MGKYAEHIVYVEPPRKRGGCLTGIGVLIVAITIAALALFYVIVPQVNTWIEKMGGSSINQVIDLYREVTAHVNEKDIVKHGFSDENYNDAKTKLEDAGFDIFDSNGNVDPFLISKKYFEEIEFKDTELAAILNNMLGYIEDLDFSFYNELKLNFKLKQIEIKETENQKQFIINAIGIINTDEITRQMGLLGGLIPQTIYLTSSAVYDFSGEQIEIINPTIKLNNIKDKSFNELLKIISKTVLDDKEMVTSVILADELSNLVKDGINALSFEFDANLKFAEGKVVLTSKMPNPADAPKII